MSFSQLLKLFEVAAVNRAVIASALASRMHDLKDAVLDQAIQYAGADVIVTRNSKDFSHGKSKVMDPWQFIVLME